MLSMDQQLSIKLAQRREDGLYRQRYSLQSAQSSSVKVDGKNYVAFEKFPLMVTAPVFSIVKLLPEATVMF